MPQVENITNKSWLARHYGSRRGFMRTKWHELLFFLGKYNHYREIDWQSVERLVFICKGNICRSAYAEAVARSTGIEAISCGLDTIEDAPANDHSISTAKQLGFDLEEHKTRPIMYLVLRKTDLLVAMEPWQAKFLEKNLTRNHQYTLLGLWTKPSLPHIQDPYGAPADYFKKCFRCIQSSVNELAKKIKKKSDN
jgi:protein-tyrosine phosphatase